VKARPQPDFKYFPNEMAASLFRKAKYATNNHGVNFDVCRATGVGNLAVGISDQV
jgi:hypothetical protein